MSSTSSSSNYLDIVQALHHYSTTEPTCLSFRKGDILYVWAKDKSGWWDGTLAAGGKRGWFPSNYVKSVPGGVGATPVLPKTTTSSLSSDPINTNTTITSGASSGRQTPNPQESSSVKSTPTSNARKQLDSLTNSLSQLISEVGNESSDEEEDNFDSKQPSRSNTPPLSTNNTSTTTTTPQQQQRQQRPKSILKSSNSNSSLQDSSTTTSSGGGSIIPGLKPSTSASNMAALANAAAAVAVSKSSSKAIKRISQYKAAVLDLPQSDTPPRSHSIPNLAGVNNNSNNNTSNNTNSSNSPNFNNTNNTQASIAAGDTGSHEQSTIGSSSNTAQAVLFQNNGNPSFSSSATSSSVVDEDNIKLPPFWGRKTTPNGRVYFFNTQTYQTTYDIKDVLSAARSVKRSTLVIQEAQNTPLSTQAATVPATAPAPKSSSSTSSDGQHEPRRSRTHSNSNWIPGPQSLLPLNSKVSWEILINNILRAISDLNQAAKLDNKSVYISHTNQVVRAIRDMLASSGTVSRNSPIMHSNKLLRSHHHHIMSSLSKLVLTSKVASGLWPPPDAINKMRYQAGQVLLSIRHFVSIAQDVPLELRPISECSVDEFDIKGAELSDIEFVSRLDAYSESIIKSITALVQNVNAFEKQQTGMDIVPGVTSTTPSSSSFSQLVSQQQLIDHARNTVTEIGQFLSLIEEIKISNVLKSSESASFMGSDGHIYTNPSPSLQSTLKLLSDFKSKKELLYAVVNDLVTTARSTMDAFAPPDALQTLMDATTLSLKAVEDLCMAAKLVIDQEELLEQRLLAEESEQLTKTSKSSLRDSAESELGLLQRRAMSLTFLKSDGAGAGGDGGQGVSGARSGGEDQIRGGASGGNPYTSSESAPPVQQTISYSSKHLPATPGGSSSDHQQLQQQPTSPQQYQDYLQRYQQHRTSQPHQRTSSQETSGSGSTTPPSSGRANAYGSKNISMPPLPNSSSSKSRTSNSGDVLGSQQLSKLEKLIGEDQVRDFLNKPKESKPWFLNHDYSPQDISFNMEGQVNGGTLTALVERLTLHDQPVDTGYMTAFLMMYRTFTSSDELLDQLIQRFFIEPPPQLSNEDLRIWQEKKQTPVRLRVYNALKSWLELYWLEPDDTALDRLLHFAKTAMSDAMPNIGTRLIEVVQKRLTGGVVVMGGRNSGFQHQQQILSAGTSSTASSYNPLATPLSNTSNTSSNFSFTSPSRQRRSVNLEECPSSILPRNMAFLLGRSATEASAAAAVILEFDPLEIARQLTLMENRIFNAIETRELMDQEWGRAKKNSVAVNVRKMSQISTQTTGLVAEMILSETDVKKRALLLKQFIKIGDRCLLLNNYASLMALLSALNSSTIIRLKRTWDALSSKTKATFENLRKATELSRNYSVYRQRLKKVVPPCVPFLGLYLTDLTFINDGNPDTRGAQGLINFDKYYKTSRIICEVQRFQHPYSLLDVVELQGWLQAQLESPLRKGIEELHRQSLLLEPRDSSSGLGGFLLSAVGGAGGGGGGSSTSSVGGGNSSRTSVSSTSSNSRRGSEHRSQYQSSSASHNNTNNDDTNSATALSDIEGKLKMLEKVGFI